VRQLAAAFEYTRNIRQTSQGGSKLPHSKAPFGRIFKNYGALGISPAKLLASMQLSFFIHAGEMPVPVSIGN
jgi:hypothetical protein